MAELVGKRRSVRLPAYDYAQAGAYFVTICTHRRARLFGEISEGEMRLNDAGRIVRLCWEDIPAHFSRVGLDEFVIMPNHVHGILWIRADSGRRGTACCAPTVEPRRFSQMVPASLPAIVRSFKSAATREINRLRGAPGASLWQRGFYEHIVRNDDDLHAIRRYVTENPVCWHEDTENPQRPSATTPR